MSAAEAQGGELEVADIDVAHVLAARIDHWADFGYREADTVPAGHDMRLGFTRYGARAMAAAVRVASHERTRPIICSVGVDAAGGTIRRVFSADMYRALHISGGDLGAADFDGRWLLPLEPLSRWARSSDRVAQTEKLTILLQQETWLAQIRAERVSRKHGGRLEPWVEDFGPPPGPDTPSNDYVHLVAGQYPCLARTASVGAQAVVQMDTDRLLYLVLQIGNAFRLAGISLGHMIVGVDGPQVVLDAVRLRHGGLMLEGRCSFSLLAGEIPEEEGPVAAYNPAYLVDFLQEALAAGFDRVCWGLPVEAHDPVMFWTEQSSPVRGEVPAWDYVLMPMRMSW